MQDQPQCLAVFFVCYDVVPLRSPRVSEAIGITVLMLLVLRTNWLIQGVKLVALRRGCARDNGGVTNRSAEQGAKPPPLPDVKAQNCQNKTRGYCCHRRSTFATLVHIRGNSPYCKTKEESEKAKAGNAEFKACLKWCAMGVKWHEGAAC